MQNPFLINVCDENIFKFYKRVYILCMAEEYDYKNSIDDVNFIFNKTLTLEQINLFPQYFRLVDANIKILYNTYNRTRATIISNKILETLKLGDGFEQT